MSKEHNNGTDTRGFSIYLSVSDCWLKKIQDINFQSIDAPASKGSRGGSIYKQNYGAEAIHDSSGV